MVKNNLPSDRPAGLRDSYYIIPSHLVACSSEKNFGTKIINDAKTIFTKPTLLVFGGNDFTKPDQARGLTKRAAHLAGIAGYDEVKLVGVYYGGNTFHYSGKYNATPRGLNFSTTAYEFAQTNFLPLLQDNQGGKIDIEVAKKHMRRVTMLGFSFGAVAAEEVGNAVVWLMKNRCGYTNAEIDAVTSQVLLVSVSGVAKLGKGEANFRRVTMANVKDIHMAYETSDKLFQSEETSNLSRLNEQLAKFGRNNAQFSVLPYTARETLIAVNHSIPAMARFSRDGDFYKLDGKLLKPTNLRQDKENHNQDSYMVPGIGKMGFFIPSTLSNILSASVENSVQNTRSRRRFTELPPTDGMLANRAARNNTTKTRNLLVEYSASNSYAARIAEATASSPLSR